MKKLCLFILFVHGNMRYRFLLRIILLINLKPSYSKALNKHDLEKAICDIDLAAVKQILATEKFTLREYHRYLDLAEEVDANREIAGNMRVTPAM